MDPELSLAVEINRRTFLGYGISGLGMLALNGLVNPQLFGANTPVTGTSKGVVNPLHFPPKAKRVIFLYQAGGPSHLETFDPKPKLAELDGKPMPESYTKGQPIAQLQGQQLRCLAPQFKFARHGKSGQEIADILPHTAKIADDICIVRSMHTDQINHDPAHTVMNTGTAIQGRPSMGSWITYGLGSDCADLPGFVVMTSDTPGGRSPQPISTRQWHSGFLPGQYQGIEFRPGADAVYYLNRPPGVSASRQRDVLDAVADLNRLRDAEVRRPEIEA